MRKRKIRLRGRKPKEPEIKVKNSTGGPPISPSTLKLILEATRQWMKDNPDQTNRVLAEGRAKLKPAHCGDCVFWDQRDTSLPRAYGTCRGNVEHQSQRVRTAVAQPLDSDCGGRVREE